VNAGKKGEEVNGFVFHMNSSKEEKACGKKLKNEGWCLKVLRERVQLGQRKST